jgi:hypothetical protein
VAPAVRRGGTANRNVLVLVYPELTMTYNTIVNTIPYSYPISSYTVIHGSRTTIGNLF